MALKTALRRIRADEGPLLRDLRLRSLADAPQAFGQSPDDAAGRSEADWQAQARAASQGDRRAWFIAEVSETPVGLVLARRRPPDDALIFSMWVEPEHRRAHVGERLIEAVRDWALGWGCRRMVLWVFAANEPAIRFYDRLGFRTEVEGPDADSGRAYGALAMSVAIGAGAGPADPGEDARSTASAEAEGPSMGSVAGVATGRALVEPRTAPPAAG
jgi:GNAT superfamily N-acetyltransferase